MIDWIIKELNGTNLFFSIQENQIIILNLSADMKRDDINKILEYIPTFRIISKITMIPDHPYFVAKITYRS